MNKTSKNCFGKPNYKIPTFMSTTCNNSQQGKLVFGHGQSYPDFTKKAWGKACDKRADTKDLVEFYKIFADTPMQPLGL